MPRTVKLSDKMIALAEAESELQSRSVAGQISHWAMIGRAIEMSPEFDYRKIQAALRAALPPDELSGEEQEVWFTEFGVAMVEPNEQEIAFYEKRRALGKGVGLSDTGEIVYQNQDA
ncbi:MAG: ParD-like family protein [Pseudomonadota bacterium]